MSARTFRVIVRGAFADLTAEQRAGLAAHAAEHEPLRAAFTPDGTLTYEIDARPFFTFRFEIAADTDTEAAAVAARGETRALAWLDERGYRHKHLMSRADEVPQTPPGARARREQRRNQRA
ncbi:hypothetical protein CC117_02090 [Parafrankia colletiae]|uniref:Uncharacterized protein n=1 Tax=Parafrankia colletiae TaxID=573497 RepID=A0A1S1RMB3_9ACTN|nr:DUF6204 family protein [Parafrankia colletiae]MCK9901163.1 DUF6204 family protein [Frankia sp. Cpl3]OHV46545.1 hypothetical protein CC117_02090 [Parafrankia colletiae]